VSDEDFGIDIEQMMQLLPGLRAHRVTSPACARESDDERVLLTMGRLKAGKSVVVCGACRKSVETITSDRFRLICDWLSS
jgi:hypothetical protein